MAWYRTTCPLNCFDSCGILVEIIDGKINNFKGDPAHPITRGFICSKGQKAIKRHFSPDRLLYPLIKSKKGFEKIDWESALALWAEKIEQAQSDYGPASLLHINDYGHNGRLKNLEHRFFRALGGYTVPTGSMCWGSGYQAQKEDFGALYSHPWLDCCQSRHIVLWGRDPAFTNIHLIPILKEAQQGGARIVVINPVKTLTADLADLLLQPRPGTDGALALGALHVLLSEGWYDAEFVAQRVNGFEGLAKVAVNWTPERTQEVTGVPAELVRELARIYGRGRPVATFFGYGLQRYANGGQTVRYIDALCGLSGNIGISGGGANYAHQYWQGLLNDIKGENIFAEVREFSFPTLAQEILSAQPPIQVISVARTNPVCQLPNTSEVLRAWRQVPFKVVMDLQLTDTAEQADLVLPVAGFLETPDVIATSWGDYIGAVPALISPPDTVKDEVEIWTELARRLNKLSVFGERTAMEWIHWLLEPLRPYGITWDKLISEGACLCPVMPQVAWAERKFATANGKMNLINEEWQSPRYYQDPEEFPLVLLTPHPKGQLHSQFFREREDAQEASLPLVEINPAEAQKRYVRNYDQVIIETGYGQLVARVSLTERVPTGIALLPEGWWLKDGGGVNWLTPAFAPDLGGGIPYYDVKCEIRKWHID
ncbi:MAG: molybdopterin-containing oxidoreductase family protein [Bacillota bacterium]